jgi:hypothetical protein
MGIQNFPAALQPIIQQGFLETEFQKPLESQLRYRTIADRETFPNKIGETITKTRPGLKNPVTTPSNPSSNTNLDNGMSPSAYTVEQYTLTINQYNDTIDLNIVNNKVGLADQFLRNAKTNGTQSAQSLDRIARATLFGGALGTQGGYLGGNTRVRVGLGSPAATLSVDDVRGFQNVLVTGSNFILAGQPTANSGTFLPVSPANTAQVLVGSNYYTLTGVTVDGSNTSTAPGGISGVLTFSGNVSTSDGAQNNQVVHYNAPTILRPSGRLTTNALQATDFLSLGLLLDAQAVLRNNAPTEAGNMTCFLDNRSMRELFADQDFKIVFQGQYGSKEYRDGMVFDLLGIRFMPTTEAYVQTLNGLQIRRPILVIQGALIEGDFEGMGEMFENETHIVDVIDDIVQVTRPPLDRLGQIIAQSWYWIGGFALPTDATANTTIIPTASNAYLKRAVVIEHA